MNTEKKVFIVVDLGFGDSGKGTIVDGLTRRYDATTIVRFNGGAQAGHNVVTPDGRHHTFSQFGSGTFVPGTKTHLSRFMLVEPYGMMKEEEHLQQVGVMDAFARTTVDKDALIITPYHIAMNRLRELARGNDRHGSCGIGVGETMADYTTFGSSVLFAGDLSNPQKATAKLHFIRDHKRYELKTLRSALPVCEETENQLSMIDDPVFIDIFVEKYQSFLEKAQIVDSFYLRTLLDEGTVIFEGAQGVLLDEWYGFHPYTTWSTTTFQNAEQLLHEQSYRGKVTKIGVVRAYATRHGAGPFVTEDAELTESIQDMHNSSAHVWQSTFRVGYFDTVAIRYALAVAGHVDYLAITHLDRMKDIPEWNVCRGYYVHVREKPTEFFAFHNNVIVAITKGQYQDLVFQEKLTQHLLMCEPLYQDIAFICNDTVENYAAFLSNALGIPIGITSRGPAADDKQYLL